MFRIGGWALKIEKIPLSKPLFFAHRILEPKIEIFEGDLGAFGELGRSGKPKMWGSGFKND